MSLGIFGNLVVKSTLSSRSGSATLRQLNPIHKKGPSSAKFFKVSVPPCFYLNDNLDSESEEFENGARKICYTIKVCADCFNHLMLLTSFYTP